ncbi:hypothetical protein PMAYCL1PPCAC_04825 [Pristionchus mayeri]|uniref:Uncharacterized protein n=1 Tax=Pristionchus mayeri TaxID=1317129 RepID=A0AAN4ZBE8_9BILA|nr:hypothetical protein PMAYCL1PPCAC_04825 [Pristionchus mayeri]
MPALFDPNHPRYYHTLCVGAHVTKAARALAIIHLLWAVVRSIAVIAISGDILVIVLQAIDVLCMFSLLLAAYYEMRLLIVPYILDEAVTISGHSTTVIYLLTGGEIPSDHLKGDHQGHRIAGYIFIICIIAINVYFFKIAVNFLVFLKNRAESDGKSAGESVQNSNYQEPYVATGHVFPCSQAAPWNTPVLQGPQ